MIRRKGQGARLIAAALVAATAACSPGEAQKAAGPPPMPAPLTAAARPAATGGERLFVERCGMCHGPGAMGTGLLARRVDPPLLEKRTDLTPDFVIAAARGGIGNMPAIPRGEVSDAEMRQIADYLAHAAAKGGR